MKIKNIVISLLLIAICFSVVSCTEPSETAPDTSEPSESVTETETETVTETETETEPEETEPEITYAGLNSGIVRDGTPKKYFTICFDDGITQDLHIIEIFKKYNFTKATFFINTGLCGENWTWVGEAIGNTNVTHIRFTMDELKTGIYDGFDVESHTLTHPSLKNYDRSKAYIKRQLVNDADNIYDITGIYPVGFAWPGGDTEYTDKTVKSVYENTGMRFARGTTSTYKFDLPTEFLKWMPTCSVNDPSALSLLQKFIDAECTEDMLFYTWGHGYEFDFHNSWGVLDTMIKMVTEADDIVLVTNAEFYQLFKDEIPSIIE